MDHFHSSCRRESCRSLRKTIGLRFLNVRCIKLKTKLRKKHTVSQRNYEKNYVVVYGTHAIPPSYVENWNYHYR